MITVCVISILVPAHVTLDGHLQIALFNLSLVLMTVLVMEFVICLQEHVSALKVSKDLIVALDNVLMIVHKMEFAI